MYSPTVINAKLNRLIDAERARAILEGRLFPPLVHGRPVREVREWTDRLAEAAPDSSSPLTRDLSPEELAFITSERLVCRCDFTYWAERYVRIQSGGFQSIPFIPNSTQRLILNRFAKVEEQIWSGEREDGLLADMLKARQLGGSTLAELCIVHRATLTANRRALVASDVPRPGALNLLTMFTTALDSLPWFMRPSVTQRVESFPGLLQFGHKSMVEFAASKSTRGKTGQRGQLGRSGTYSLLHLSELSTWENPSQIDSALMPAVPEPEPEVFALFESTAKGENSWWQRHWNLSKSGSTRFVPIFIPWYAEPQKYRRRPPVTWSPSPSTQAHAEKVWQTSARWMEGRRVRLTPDQMYWYETRRAQYEANHELSVFLEEFPADDEEAFQATSNAVFSASVIQKIKDLAAHRELRAVVEIAPAWELQRAHPEELQWTPLQ